MAVVSELLLVASFLAFTYVWESKTGSGIEKPITGAIEEIVQTYEKTLSLYDLLAHFPVDNDIVCPESDTRLPYPGDCTRYITCRDYKAHIRGCPRGMRFDKKVLRCRFHFQTTCEEFLDTESTCGSNEVFSTCGPSCEKSCEDQKNDYEDCPEECVKGCFCKEGFVRGPLRNCIPPRKCKSNTLIPWFLIDSRRKM